MDGILPVYKPVGMTSYDVIREFKLHITRTVPDKYKIGHGGTLDPFAEGVLLLLLGKATKRMNELLVLPKTYLATAVLGARSDTLDRTGKIEQCHSVTVSQNQIEVAAKRFVGEIEQEIPAYSAAKVKGVPRYKLARTGRLQTRKSKLVRIYALELVHYDNSNCGSKVEFETTVSSGTYIRQLSYDLFKSLGVESYLESLTRTQIGDFGLEKCCNIKDFTSDNWKEYVTMF